VVAAVYHGLLAAVLLVLWVVIANGAIVAAVVLCAGVAWREGRWARAAR
jgi:hypothetical protein